MKRVIAINNLPSRPPLYQTATVWLMLDRFQHPGWVSGFVWTVMGLLWIACIVGMCRETHVDVFEGYKK